MGFKGFLVKAKARASGFLLPTALCFGLFLLPSLAEKVYAAFCPFVEEANFILKEAAWVVGFVEPYTKWMDDGLKILKIHKLQPGVFSEAVGLKGLIASTSQPDVLAEVRTSVETVTQSSFYPALIDRFSPESHIVNTKLSAIKDGAAMGEYQTAKRSYEMTLEVDRALEGFSPSKMDVAAASQVQKDLVKLKQLSSLIKAETLRLEAHENTTRALAGN